ncbi:MAG: NAD(P)-dependent oxidoreductase [Candidatus Omnitrophota bacterium]
MKILIVGGAGYLGGAITDILASAHYEVRIYDLLLYEETYRKNIPFIYGDIRNAQKLKKHLQWADVVIWLAALVGDPACSLNERVAREINTGSVRFLRENFNGRIIFMSTCSVYGAAEDELGEESPLNPLSLYAQSKLDSENILSGSNSIIFRLGTLYGIGDNFSRIRFDLVVNTLIMRAIFHNKINVFGGRQYRPLLHVRDAAAMVCSSLERDNTGIYNLHSENVTIFEIAERIKKFFPSLNIEICETMFQDNRNYRVSSRKAAHELNFNPKLKIEDCIRELKEMLEDGRVKNSFITRFSNYLYLKPLLTEYSSPLGKVIKFNI